MLALVYVDIDCKPYAVYKHRRLRRGGFERSARLHTVDEMGHMPTAGGSPSGARTAGVSVRPSTRLELLREEYQRSLAAVRCC